MDARVKYGLLGAVGSVVVVAVVALVLWAGGTFDRGPCAQNAFGTKLCGDDLLSFCVNRYEPDLNRDACETVLLTGGFDPAAIARENEAEEAERRERLLERLGFEP